MAGQAPVVSILIPNFNNGRQSTREGQLDLIDLLCRSLQQTLADDPTPLEILAHDDGSTDDSLPTLRHWAQKRWRDDQPFLELTEAEHCGVLAKVANALTRRARGRILVRLDGDTEMLTPRWAQKLVSFFDQARSGTGVVGPKQLRPDHRIHAFGDWLIHPNGYHHIAAGHPRDAVRYPMEVDHVMGCFYCYRREVFDELGGFDETFLRGQTVEFGVRVRHAGWRCFAIPQIEYVHYHSLRQVRQTEADSGQGIIKSIDRFGERWGFSRIAPDLDVVRERYGDTPLCWHPRWTAEPTLPPEADQPIDVDQSQWGQFSKNQDLQQRVTQTANIVQQATQQVPGVSSIVHVRSGQGLVAHLLAKQGMQVIGVEASKHDRAIAELCVGRDSYPSGPPKFIEQPNPRGLPLNDGSVGLLLFSEYLEWHANPVGALNEARRVLQPGGLMVIIAQRRRTIDFDPAGPTHPYQAHELIQQVSVLGGWQLLHTPDDNPQTDLILIARRN